MQTIMVIGAGGRVGSHLIATLIDQPFHIVAVDKLAQSTLAAICQRLLLDQHLQSDVTPASKISVHGDVDALNKERIAELAGNYQPVLVVNYAIPFTWDATKQLSNYQKISAAGLGAFAAVQVLTPKRIGEALASEGFSGHYLVGNLPDITIPILRGLSQKGSIALPTCGAGNVGLIESSLKALVAKKFDLKSCDLTLFLVAHHIHWVAPREPGYAQHAPFKLKVMYQDRDITDSLGDCRELMNRSITEYYEAGAGFSSTTGILAAKTVMALLDDTKQTRIHSPAPLGLAGGYPVLIDKGEMRLDLPDEWELADTQEAMQQAQYLDGVGEIAADGSFSFNPDAVAIVKQELKFELPDSITSDNIEDVAFQQIRAAEMAVLNR